METEKRLIYADDLLAKFKEHRDLYAPSWEAFKASSISVKYRVDEIDTCMADVINAPSVDAVEVVRCKDCLWSYRVDCREPRYACLNICRFGCSQWLDSNDFCSYGERRTDEN